MATQPTRVHWTLHARRHWLLAQSSLGAFTRHPNRLDARVFFAQLRKAIRCLYLSQRDDR